MTTVRQIITRALGELLYLAEGETPTAGQASDSLDALNSLIASWRNEGMMIAFPTGTNWRGEWDERLSYAVNDSVSRNGSLYVCSTAHESVQSNRPGVSINGGTYWTAFNDTLLTLDATFPLPAQFERGVVSLLAVELGPTFGKDPSPFTQRKASDGKTALLAAYMPIAPVGVDVGLTRLPSNVWPYNVGTVS